MPRQIRLMLPKKIIVNTIGEYPGTWILPVSRDHTRMMEKITDITSPADPSQRSTLMGKSENENDESAR